MQCVAACRLLQSSVVVGRYCCCLQLRLWAVARHELPGPGGQEQVWVVTGQAVPTASEGSWVGNAGVGFVGAEPGWG